jgi:hypothetical protein
MCLGDNNRKRRLILDFTWPRAFLAGRNPHNWGWNYGSMRGHYEANIRHSVSGMSRATDMRPVFGDFKCMADQDEEGTHYRTGQSARRVGTKQLWHPRCLEEAVLPMQILFKRT